MTTAVYRSTAGGAEVNGTVNNVTVPAGVTTTDICLLLMGWATTTTDETPPSATATGFTDLVAVGSYNNMGFAALRRIGGLSPTDTIAATLSTGKLMKAKAYFYDQGDTVPIIGTVGHRAGVSQAFQNAPSITTTVAGQTVAFLAAERTPASGTTVSSAPYTQRDYDESTTGSTVSFFLSDTDQAVAGATGTQTITYSASSGNGTAMQIAFGEDTPPPPVTTTLMVVRSGRVPI